MQLLILWGAKHQFMSLTELTNRKVWFDGTSQVDPDMVPELFLHGVSPENIAVNYLNEDIKKFNTLSDIQIAHSKNQNRVFSYDWNVPEKYLDLNISAYAEGKLELYLQKISNTLTENDVNNYFVRLKQELQEIQNRNMNQLFCCLVYVLQTLKETNTVWGVGRGSSCASLVLFLIGIHKVDPVKFGIPATEFFHD